MVAANASEAGITATSSSKSGPASARGCAYVAVQELVEAGAALSPSRSFSPWDAVNRSSAKKKMKSRVTTTRSQSTSAPRAKLTRVTTMNHSAAARTTPMVAGWDAGLRLARGRLRRGIGDVMRISEARGIAGALQQRRSDMAAS
jgi:hypothetical protein